ncbi:MAG: TonB-dependent receptor [Chitinophagaceae bacterium]|nr:TonB-dependent receptor [Chitinophagaceae bacterium]
MKRSSLVYLLILTGAFFSPQRGIAQEQRITVNLANASLPVLAQEVERQSSYRFYFDPAETDSLRVTVAVNNVTIDAFLQQVFQNTGFLYAVDRQGRIFISKKNKIQTSLPAGFFNRGLAVKDTLAEIFNTTGEPLTDKSALRSSIEKKLFEIGSRTGAGVKGNAKLVGYVRDVKTGEALSGATVYMDTPSIKTVTDQFGYFVISVPRGRSTLRVSSVGMKDTKRELMVYADGKLNVEMEDYVASLKAVTVTTERRSNIRGLQMGVERVNVRTIKQVPTVFGESDILRVVLTLPGVTSVGEASTGFNVRGGAADQNLILLNDATIYNPSHLFGFFSAFNTDVVKGVELYKSAIPEKYGGRLSSVLDVATRDGNNKKFSGSGGIGILTSRLTLEGPLDKKNKEKTTFILGGRTTYSDWILRNVPDPGYSHSSASFYDLNLNLTHNINPKNTLYLTGYISHDRFRLSGDTLYTYGNRNLILKWRHNFNSTFYSVLSAGSDRYQYEMGSVQVPLNAFKLSYDVNQLHARAEFNYTSGNRHTFNFGLHTIYYKIHPGSFQPASAASLVIRNEVPAEQALESSFYLGDKYNITPDLSISAGIRYSIFNYLGPHDVYGYVANVPRDAGNLIDTAHYAAGKNINTWQGPEFRLSLRYSLSADASVKLSFNTLRQYIHTLSNTTAISPTDIWKLSDQYIRPQEGYQMALGYYRNFSSNTIETSVEVYYKRMSHYLDYKSGATLLMNKHIETDVINTGGEAYGIEVMIKKTVTKLNGWLSYTYSRTMLRMDDPIAGELINKGNYYPANFDKPHNVNFIGNYKFSHRLSLSINGVYSTGRPITLPIAIFNQAGSQRVFYSDRNQYRIPDYIRADISLNIEGNHRIKKLAHSSWSLGVYNALARQNPYSVFFAQENGLIKGYQLSVFGTAIPFLTYNFKF